MVNRCKIKHLQKLPDLLVGFLQDVENQETLQRHKLVQGREAAVSWPEPVIPGEGRTRVDWFVRPEVQHPLFQPGQQGSGKDLFFLHCEVIIY